MGEIPFQGQMLSMGGAALTIFIKNTRNPTSAGNQKG
jgi:hypothetical protein